MRRLRAAAALILAGAAVASSAAPALADPTPAQAIAELNAWRGSLGEAPVSTSDVPAWDTGCQHHNAYEQAHQITHFETDTDPANGYTSDGAVAGPDSVLAVVRGGPGPQPDGELLPGPVWDGAVFHRAALLEPRLANVGWASSTYQSGSLFSTWSCMWIQNQPTDPPALTPVEALDNNRRTLALTLYPSPANGAYDVPTTFPGHEGPDPTTDTGLTPGSTLGWLLNVELNGPWADAGDGGIVYAHDVVASLAPDGSPGAPVPVHISECGPSGCGASGGTSLGPEFAGGFGIFPLQPLAANTTYRVVLTGGSVHDSTPPGHDYSLSGASWCFSTGSTYTPSADCAAGPGAGFEPAAAVSLTTNVQGQGTLTGSGISCPGTCVATYAPGTQVTLTATPAAGQRFAGWSGGGCSNASATCTVTLNSDVSVIAIFAPAAVTLHVAVTGPGSVTGQGIACPGQCSATFAPGTVVTLTETPGAGRRLLSWSGGGCTGATPTCRLTITADTTITAAFGAGFNPGFAPRIDSGRLSLRGSSGTLVLVVRVPKGGAPIKSISIGPASGTSFARAARSLHRGVIVSRSAPGRRFSVAVRGGRLVISLRSGTGSVSLTIRAPALVVSRSVLGDLARGHVHSFAFSVLVTDVGGDRTPLRAAFTLR